MKAQYSDWTLETYNSSTDSKISQFHLHQCCLLLGVLVGIFAMSTIILSLILALKIPITVDNEICTTPYCVKAANYLLKSINETVEPCEDFYNFACGTWIKNTALYSNDSAVEVVEVLRNQLYYKIIDLLTPLPNNDTKEPNTVINARKLYHSCMNETNIENEGSDVILSLINKEFGGWPILQGSSWNNSNFNLFNILFKLRKYNYNIIFSISTTVDEKNSSRCIIQINQGDLGLGQRSHYINESKVNNAYRKFMIDLARSLTNNTSMIEQDVNDIFIFEKNLAKYYWTLTEQIDRMNRTIRTNFGNLSAILNINFNFRNYLYSAYSWAGVTLFDNDTVVISNYEYLENISLIINQTSPRTLQNYIIWRFIMHRVANMPKRFQDIKEDFNQIFYGYKSGQRNVMCANFVNLNMGFVVSRLYIKKYFDDNAQNQSLEMFKNIRQVFINMIEQSTWMDDISKTKAIEKAQIIDEKIGYPKEIANDNVTVSEEAYSEFIFNSSYINNILRLFQIGAKQGFLYLRKSNSRYIWSTAPITVNAFYSRSKNQISISAGILQMPFFDKDAPKYLNYGGIGTIIGHEITHGFDHSGREYDKNGNRIPWWTFETIEKFNQRKTCIVDQYNNYTIPGINIKANGSQTQDEDIADNGGLREAFFAYQKWSQANPNVDKRLPGLLKYSPEQLFFINYAYIYCAKMSNLYAYKHVLSQRHSIKRLRVLGSTSNFDEFDRVFNCKPGQRNSRINKCIVW